MGKIESPKIYTNVSVADPDLQVKEGEGGGGGGSGFVLPALSASLPFVISSFLPN